MYGNRLFTGVYNFCKWICYFFYLNMMWGACTLLGGVVFGVTPSTVALFTVARKTALGEEDIPVFNTFWRTYKAEFFRANRLGLILLGLGLVWYFDLNFFRQFEGTVFTLLNSFMTLTGIVYIMLLLYIFPVYVHYEMKTFSYIKYSIAFGFLHPGNLIIMLVTVVSTYYFLAYFQAFLFLVGVSLLAQLNMWLAFQSFRKIAHVKNQTAKTKYNNVPA